MTVRLKSLTEEPHLHTFKFVDVVPIARDIKERGDPSKFQNKNMKENVVLRYAMQKCVHLESLSPVLSCDKGDIPAHLPPTPMPAPFCMWQNISKVRCRLGAMHATMSRDKRLIVECKKRHRETDGKKKKQEQAVALFRGGGGGHPTMVLKALRCSNGNLQAKGVR